MSRPVTRVLDVLDVLQARGLVTAADLAERLEVDPRSVRRYVAALREIGVPVRATRGRYGGYRLAPGYRLPPLMLADDEAVAVAAALAAAGEREGPGEPSPTARALVKLNRVLPGPLRERVNALVDATAVGHTRTPLTPDPDVALTLAAAVRSHRRVRIDHTRADGAPTTREVDPYGLVVHERWWYLVAHDHLRGALRTYRLDRITRAAELPRRFVPPAGFDPEAHVVEALTVGAWAHRVEVLLEVDPATARAELGARLGRLDAEGDRTVLVSGANDLDAMARLLAGLPWPFTIRTPGALAAAFAAHVDRLGRSIPGAAR